MDNTVSQSAEATAQGCALPKLLIGLPEKTPHIKFVNIQQLIMAVNKQASEYGKDIRHNSPFLVVSEIPPTVIDDLEHAIPDFRWHLDLDLNKRLLVIETMAAAPHETTCAEFDHLFQAKVNQMGTHIHSRRTTRVKHGNFIKEPDLSWMPLMNRAWPTLVVEVGVSESHAKLAIDAQGWLEANLSGVNMAVTINVDRQHPIITIERWERAHPTHTHATRFQERLMMARVSQTVTIDRTFGVTNASGELSIPFQAIFERSPQGNERDFLFSKSELASLAEEVWGTQGF